MIPVFVIDPNQAGELTKWQTLSAAADAFSDSPPSEEPSENVLTATQLLNEALWWTCRPDKSATSDDPPISPTQALDVLRRFELHCYEAKTLENQVVQFLELLFPGGLADTQQQLLLGWLYQRATSSQPERHLFSVRELLAEIGVLEAGISLTPGTLKAWRDLWNEVSSGIRARTRLRIGQEGVSLPARDVQPVAVEALTNAAEGLVILGPGGAGKTTFVAQAAEDARQRGDDVLPG